MLVGVVLARLVGVVSCVQGVAVGYVGVMGCFFVITGFMVSCSFAMMLSCLFVVLGCVFVVLGTCVIARHFRSSF